MAVAEIASFVVQKGTTWLTAFIWGDAPVDETEPGALLIPGDKRGRFYIPYNITGFSAKMQIRRHPDAVVIDTFTEADNLGIVGPDGIINLSTLADWDFAVAEYALKMTSPGGEPSVISRGLIYLEPEITV